MSPKKYQPYNPKENESEIYALWEKSGAFTPKIDPKKKPFTIIMPPPNITGSLHCGHAMFLTLEDIMTRYHRMKGEAALWLPGLDHAAIAVQNVVEKKLAKEGTSRFDLGREKFIQACKDFIEEYREKIINQIKKSGSSCDWSRLAYTMDKERYHAVMEAFVRLYNEGLIYRGEKYLINWCPRCQTALSDLEVEYEERNDPLYYIKYGPFTLATVRPETKFGDTAIAVHPNDKRYKKYVGQEVECEGLIGKFKLKVIADKMVDPKFGTGVVKVTPAHDPKDFETGKRHNLESKRILDFEGRLTEITGPYTGMKVKQARQKVAEDLKQKGLMKKIDTSYTHSIGTCYRCSTDVEPMLTTQWFVNVQPMAKKAMKAVKDKKTKILPKRFEKVYFQWLENIHDWCISRQIWWGQRIPAWYCGTQKMSPLQKVSNQIGEVDGCGEIIVSVNKPKKCPKCGNQNLIQDPDTLDTWFSSGLWPISTLGWPDEKAPDFKYFYPTSVMETGYDILFFWVVRMMMMCLHFAGKVPFEIVYLHGLVRDKHNQKMSKSKGNVIDPLLFMEQYGTDALRMALIVGQSAGNDLPLSEEKIKGYRNFINKIWNASRFVLMNLEEDQKPPAIKQVKQSLTKDDQKMLKEINRLTKSVTQNLEKYRFGQAGEKIYHSFWHVFCDWYLEAIKSRLQKEGDSKKAVRAVLLESLKIYLKLLHPFAPFVTESIWQKLPREEKNLISAAWPQ